ncbi:MAG: CTP synthase [Candidatus Kerfeldbacteria bacterium]|nr:CTP synthase [Candidatus Kerfeldbacteria bacterium]
MPRHTRSRTATRSRTRRKTRYLFVFGGVLSGVGKGTAVASIGRILLSKGYRVTAMKIDPYLNVDAGTMNPIEHGEVFVTDDGLESDQDLGNYERFLDQDMGRINYMTSGQVYLTVIQQERNLAYGGKCVETVPHIPEEVTKRIHRLARSAKADFVLIEVGGTVGEYQNLVFLEAARMMKLKEPDAVQFLMVSYLPIPSKIGEMKTKPTQHAVQRLNSAGIQPDYLLCRATTPIDKRRREKLSIFCNVRPENVISAPDVDFIYEVPVNLNREHLGDKILAGYGLTPRQRDLRQWTAFVAKVRRLKQTVRIAIVGKYFSSGSFTFADSYISVIEAIKHAAWSLGRKPLIEWINAEELSGPTEQRERLKEFDGVVVPGGFGVRGIEGKIAAIQFVRKRNIPYFGLCFGMQLAVIEYARNALGLKDASSRELHPRTTHPVIDIMEAQKKNLKEHRYGGSMRLGAFRCRLAPGTVSAAAYRARLISERHRHRYELNNRYRDQLQKAGMTVAGINPELDLVEIIELPNHPFFVGVQFHPEFLSRPLTPHPLFAAFVKAAVDRSSQRR